MVLCVRLRPERPSHVRSYDFMENPTLRRSSTNLRSAEPLIGSAQDGRKVRMLIVVDEYTRECLRIRVARKLKGTDVIDVPRTSLMKSTGVCF